MKWHKVETHLHTYEGSACASITGDMQAICRYNEGYEAIMVTNHFYNGNTRPDRNLPWEEYVDAFASGYESAKKKGDEIGLKVFFGWEENFDGAEFLCFGPDKEWLKQHPEMINWTPWEYYEKIHEAGGFIIQAHPFRMRGYLKGIKLYPEYCDAVEAYNLSNRPIDNIRAEEYAKSFKLPMTGGSDIHHTDFMGGGMLFKNEINSIEDFIREIKGGCYKVITEEDVEPLTR